MTDHASQPTAIELLRSMPVFGGLDHSALQFLFDQSNRVEVARENCFFCEGDEGSSMFVLASGQVAIHKSWRQHTLQMAALGPGDCFGEMALIDLHPRSASVLALSDCLALEISTATLHGLYQHDLKQFTLIQMNLARELSRRLRGAYERLFALDAQHPPTLDNPATQLEPTNAALDPRALSLF